MTDRSFRDDYAEMMTLLPEGNRQIIAVVGNGFCKLTRALAGWLRHAIQRKPDDHYLP